MKNRLQFIVSIAGILALFVLCSYLVYASFAEPGAAPEKADAGFSWKAFLAPFHIVTLHLPIGILTIAVFLEFASFIQRSDDLRNGITMVLWVGGVTGTIAALFGLFLGESGGYDPDALWDHQKTGIAMAVLTCVIAVLHTLAFRKGPPTKSIRLIYRILLIADVVLLGAAGHYGGNLTHGSTFLTKNAPEWAQPYIAKLEGREATGGGGAEKGAGMYAEKIQPIFEEKCYSCHGEEKQKSDYRMDTIKGLFSQGESEIDPIEKGNPMKSYLVEMLTLPKDDDLAMPPDKKEVLTPEEIMLIFQWVWDGAKTK